MPIENKLNILLENAENLDLDLLEEVRQKAQADIAALALEEAKKEDKKDSKDEKEEKTDEAGNTPADEQDEEPAVKIDNPINPDLNASDEDGDGVDDAEEEQEQQQEQTQVDSTKSMKESVAELLGDEFSEDFKLKAVTIFEAAVKEQVKAIEESLKADTAAKEQQLQESFDTRLADEVKAIEEKLSEEINGYLTFISEEWLRSNELAIQTSVKAELVESFIDGLKTLFEEHYVDLPAEKVDVFAQMTESNKQLETQLSEIQAKLSELSEAHNAVIREKIIAESAKDFTGLDFERFKVLTEDFDFENEDTFRKKVDIVKNAFFETKNRKSAQETKALSESFQSKQIVEEKQIVTEETAPTSAMSSYIKYLGKR